MIEYRHQLEQGKGQRRSSRGRRSKSSGLIALQRALVLACLIGAATPALARQPTASPETDKWRPKDGPYASPSKDFDNQCGEFDATRLWGSQESSYVIINAYFAAIQRFRIIKIPKGPEARNATPIPSRTRCPLAGSLLDQASDLLQEYSKLACRNLQ